MKANPDKFQFIILENTGSHTLYINVITRKSSSSVPLFGITIDFKIDNINNTTQKACYKLYALRRL